MPTQIRYAEPSDLPEIYQMICDLEYKVFDKIKFQHIFIENLKNQKIFYKLALVEGEIAGFISLHIQHFLYLCGEAAELREVIVKKKFRVRGIGRMLMEEAKEIALKNRCVRLEVASHVTRKDAHRFYKRVGFRRDHYKFVFDL
jgi:PhnO protein